MKRINAKELIGKKLTVRDLMRVMDDIDVYDDVCEELGIAFCNPFDDDEVHDWSEYLTERGMKQFSDVLDYPMEIFEGCVGGCEYAIVEGCVGGCAYAIVKVDDDDDNVWRAKLIRAKRFFESAAGYCSCEDHDKWFKM